MTENSQLKKEICGIILAAGMGTRMGSAKQLLEYAGKPLLQHVIDSAKQSRLSKVIAILGYQALNIKASVDFTNVLTVTNQHFETGQGSSIRASLPLIPDRHQAALFLLGDQPMVTPEIINRILDHFQTTDAQIIIPAHKRKRGNPVLIARSLFAELYKLSGDSGGRELFTRYADQTELLEIGSSAILRDVDTLDDYNALVNSLADPSNSLKK